MESLAENETAWPKLTMLLLNYLQISIAWVQGCRFRMQSHTDQLLFFHIFLLCIHLFFARSLQRVSQICNRDEKCGIRKRMTSVRSMLLGHNSCENVNTRNSKQIRILLINSKTCKVKNSVSSETNGEHVQG